MYIGFEAAFGFRREGLDTVYLLSDGLPNQGEGLTPHQSKTLDGVERGVAAGQARAAPTLKTSGTRFGGEATGEDPHDRVLL